MTPPATGDNNEEVVYRRDQDSRGRMSAYSLVTSIPRKWELMAKIIVRDLSARYRQSFLGYFWALVMPLAALAIFALISKYRILPMGQLDMPYILFGVWSLSIWQLFSGTLVSCTNSLSNAGPLVTKINFPKDVLVLSAVGQPTIEFLIRVCFILILFVFFEFRPGSYFFLIPLIVVAILLLSIGLGFFLSIANLLARDIGNVVSLFMIVGIFLAPVLYPAPVKWPFTLVNFINPVSPLLIATQDLLSGSELSHPWLLGYSLTFSVLVFFLGWKFFIYVLPRAIERA